MPPVILIIEDEELILQNLIDFIEMRGYSPLVARSAFQAKEMAANLQIDLILCDIHLPGFGLTGIELAENLAHQGINIPFLFQTADVRPETKVLAEEYGKLISKPFSLMELVQLIEESLSETNE